MPQTTPNGHMLAVKRSEGSAPAMKELVYPRLLLPQAERFADKIGFIDVTR